MGWEAELIRALQSAASPLLDAFFLVLTQCGGDLFWLIAIFICFAAGRKRYGVGLSVLLLTSFYGTYALKHAIGRPRPGPELRRPVAEEELSPSMPSTHASEAAGNFGYVAEKNRKKWAIGVCALLAGLSGLSRIYLGVHWPTDVLAGFAFGLLILAIWAWLVEPRMWAKLGSLAERLNKAYFTPLPILIGLAIAFLTPPGFGGPPPTYVGGLVAGMFLGAIMAEEEQRDIKTLEDISALTVCVAIGFFGLAASMLVSAGVLQFIASALTGIWATWIGPRALWQLKEKLRPMTHVGKGKPYYPDSHYPSG